MCSVYLLQLEMQDCFVLFFRLSWLFDHQDVWKKKKMKKNRLFFFEKSLSILQITLPVFFSSWLPESWLTGIRRKVIDWTSIYGMACQRWKRWKNEKGSAQSKDESIFSLTDTQNKSVELYSRWSFSSWSKYLHI